MADYSLQDSMVRYLTLLPAQHVDSILDAPDFEIQFGRKVENPPTIYLVTYVLDRVNSTLANNNRRLADAQDTLGRLNPACDPVRLSDAFVSSIQKLKPDDWAKPTLADQLSHVNFLIGSIISMRKSLAAGMLTFISLGRISQANHVFYHPITRFSAGIMFLTARFENAVNAFYSFLEWSEFTVVRESSVDVPHVFVNLESHSKDPAQKPPLKQRLKRTPYPFALPNELVKSMVDLSRFLVPLELISRDLFRVVSRLLEATGDLPAVEGIWSQFVKQKSQQHEEARKQLATSPM